MYRDFPDLSPRSSRIPPYSLPSNHVLSRCFLFLAGCFTYRLLENARLLPLALPHRHRVVTASSCTSLIFPSAHKSTIFLVLIILQKNSRSLRRNSKQTLSRTAGFFFSIFCSLTCLKKPIFSKAGSSAEEEGTHSNHRRAYTLLLCVTPQILLVYCDPGRGKRKRTK